MLERRAVVALVGERVQGPGPACRLPLSCARAEERDVFAKAAEGALGLGVKGGGEPLSPPKKAVRSYTCARF